MFVTEEGHPTTHHHPPILLYSFRWPVPCFNTFRIVLIQVAKMSMIKLCLLMLIMSAAAKTKEDLDQLRDANTFLGVWASCHAYFVSI